jgi:hypothetical protein
MNLRAGHRSWAAICLAVSARATACGGEVETTLSHFASGGGAEATSETPDSRSTTVGAAGGMATDGGSAGDTVGGGGASEVPIPVGNVSREEFAQLYPTIVCGNWAGCCGPTSFESEGCLAARAAAVAVLLDDPLVEYDPAGGGTCLRAAQAASAGCGNATPDPAYGACRAAFHGVLPLGANCTSDAQCASPADGTGICAASYTDPAQMFCEYVLLPRHGSLGEPCYCTPDGQWESCITYWTVSGPLEQEAGCYVVDGLYCDGVCRSIGGLGDPCNIYKESCAPGLACNNYVCQWLPGSGELCMDGLCQSDLFCNAEGWCEQLGRLGEPCQTTYNGSTCEPTIHCSLSTGICAGPEPNGALCRSPMDCQSDLCGEDGTSGRCTDTASATYCAYFSGAIPALPPVGL